MRTDPVTLKVLENHAQAVAESMAFTLFRTAHSTFVKETEDFTTGLVTPSGMTFASPRDLGATWFIGLDYKGALEMIDDYEEGDICVTNDPYSGFVCTHTPDMHIWKPIFWEGEIIAFAVGHIHNTDMGGAVPASLSRANTEVHQEGIRFRPTKLISRGVMNDQLIETMMLNVRMPDQNRGDLNAQIAAVNTGEAKMHEMIRKFGVETVKNGIEDLLDVGEARARAVISGLPDGDHRFVDYLDEDGPGGVPVRLELTLKVRGDEVIMDFTGSDPQLKSALNMPTGGNPRHILLMVGYNYCLYTLDPSIPLNGGILRAATCVVPEGTVLNPQYPAAVGMRSLTCGRLQGVIMGAFHAAAPDRLPVGAAGGGGIVNVKTFDAASGKLSMASIDPVTGGAGGSALGDGTDGSGANSAFLKNTPVEINEVEVPIKFRRYGLVPDSGGPGTARGGMATELEVEVFTPDTVITARNRDRTIFAAWGGAGGQPGAPSLFTRVTPKGEEINLGNTDVVTMGPGDVFNLTSGGGAGYGDPFARPVDLVVRDVLRGSVTPEKAKASYGVVVDREGVLDAAATKALRDAHVAPAPTTFSYNESRRAYEAIWTDANYAALTQALTMMPVHWRHFVKREVFDRIEALPETARKGDGSEVWEAVEAVKTRVPGLARSMQVQEAAE
ncbi:hydantoinase B/oxoprolinase family protein [Maritimibacter alkaliphilus]|uniref:hydantoinase B/oxoprolinase family protein n=1 Tax=Maritimibacter alkaliphilus TaxID=404236 RepID=UPI001C98545C|nr:hydantoinase B/oxoprolinase family protein [Maritimibacter alkaliphilus]MBY6092024.1 hydantoinase B/oxoprolinase family protein [Maritimibacter alkaliphilus]